MVSVLLPLTKYIVVMLIHTSLKINSFAIVNQEHEFSFLQNIRKRSRKHTAMPAKAVTMTKEDEDIFLHNKNEQDNGVISRNTTPTFTNHTKFFFQSHRDK